MAGKSGALEMSSLPGNVTLEFIARQAEELLTEIRAMRAEIRETIAEIKRQQDAFAKSNKKG